MKILEFIKNIFTKIFRKDNKKLLESAKKEKIQPNNIQESKEKFSSELKQKNENMSKSERIALILTTAGCDENINNIVDNLEDIDVNQMKNNLMLLSKLKFTKLEMNMILEDDIELIYANTNILKEKIVKLNNFLGNDARDVKNLIVNNPYILTDSDILSLEDINKILTDARFSKNEQKYILSENYNIFNLNKERLEKSIKLLNIYFQSSEDFKNKILENPYLIGISDKKVLDEYLIKEVV